MVNTPSNGSDLNESDGYYQPYPETPNIPYSQIVPQYPTTTIYSNRPGNCNNITESISYQYRTTGVAGLKCFESSQDGYTLSITQEPTEEHRARYATEGARGSITAYSKHGHPTIQLTGYEIPKSSTVANPPKLKVQIFLVKGEMMDKNHGDRMQINPQYQPSAIEGKTCTPNSYSVKSTKYHDPIDNHIVDISYIEIDWNLLTMSSEVQDYDNSAFSDLKITQTDWSLSLDCISLLKLRNQDVEQMRKQTFKQEIPESTKNRKRVTKCSQNIRLYIRVEIPNNMDEEDPTFLDVMSNPIFCGQVQGNPKIEDVKGNKLHSIDNHEFPACVTKDLHKPNQTVWIMGKNFSKGKNRKVKVLEMYFET